MLKRGNRLRITLGFLTLGATLSGGPARADSAWPSLEDALLRAQRQAPEVLQARGELGRANAMQVGARMSSWGNPYLEIVADRALERTAVERERGVQVQGMLFWPVEIGGQRSARLDEVKAQINWRQEGRLLAESQALGAVTFAYGNAVIASARIVEAERAEREARAELAWFVARTQAGDATAVDRNLAEVEVARWGQLKAEAEVRLAEARGAVSVLTGLVAIDRPPATETPDPPAMRSASADAYVGQVLARAPSLTSLDREGVYWDKLAERAEADRSPVLNLVLTGGRGELGEPRAGGGLAWTFPIVRRNEGEIAVARYEKQRAVTLRASLATVLETRARAAFEEYGLARSAVATLDAEGLPAHQRMVEATYAAFKAGKLELVRVLNARRDLATARARRLDLDEIAWRAYGQMAALTGERP